MNEIEELETKLFERYYNYFIESTSGNDAFDKAFNKFLESDCLNSTISLNYDVEKFFMPQFGIGLRGVVSSLRENKTTFKNYIKNILLKPDYNIQSMYNQHFNEENEGILDVLLNNSDNGSLQDTEEDADNIKKEVIRKSLGNENLELDNLTSEEIDALMAKSTGTIEEKVSIILNHLSEKEDTEKAYYISKYTGMHYNEALIITKEYV